MLFTLDHFIVIFTLYSHAYQILELRSRDILGNGQRHVSLYFLVVCCAWWKSSNCWRWANFQPFYSRRRCVFSIDSALYVLMMREWKKDRGERDREKRECCRQHMLLSWQRVRSVMSFCAWISFYSILQRRRVHSLLFKQIRNIVILRKMIRSLVSLCINLFATCWARIWVDWGVEWSRARTFVF